jgi:hypothetical protein
MLRASTERPARNGTLGRWESEPLGLSGALGVGSRVWGCSSVGRFGGSGRERPRSGLVGGSGVVVLRRRCRSCGWSCCCVLGEGSAGFQCWPGVFAKGVAWPALWRGSPPACCFVQVCLDAPCFHPRSGAYSRSLFLRPIACRSLPRLTRLLDPIARIALLGVRPGRPNRRRSAPHGAPCPLPLRDSPWASPLDLLPWSPWSSSPPLLARSCSSRPSWQPFRSCGLSLHRTFRPPASGWACAEDLRVKPIELPHLYLDAVPLRCLLSLSCACARESR